MQSEMRIALDVRLYEEVLLRIHEWYSELTVYDYKAEDVKLLIRRMEANAYEVTWKRRK